MPFMSPDMTRKAPMYWACFSSMTSQPAITTKTVMKLLRMMKGIEIPSTPSR